MEWAGTILSLALIIGGLAEEGTDSCLARCVVKSLVLEWSGRFVVVDERWHAFDVHDCRQSLMGDREEAGRHSTVNGGDGDTLIRGGAPRETTGSGRGRRRVADDGEAGVGRGRGGGRGDTRVLAGLG